MFASTLHRILIPRLRGSEGVLKTKKARSGFAGPVPPHASPLKSRTSTLTQIRWRIACRNTQRTSSSILIPRCRAQRFPRAPSLRVRPLCLPMQFSFDRLTKTVRVVPAADGGIFSEHNDLRNRLSNIVGSSFYGVTAELQAEARALKRLAAESGWLLIADRAQEGALAFDVPRVALQRCDKRDLGVYTNDRSRFVRELDQQLRRCNYTPSSEALNRLITDLNVLLNDGLLSLVATSANSPTVDERRTRGLLGTLVGAAWYRRNRASSLIVSIDSPEARRWLELRETNDRADLFGVEYESDDGFVIDLIEVKTYQHPEDAYRLTGREISGDAIDQLLNHGRRHLRSLHARRCTEAHCFAATSRNSPSASFPRVLLRGTQRRGFELPLRT